MKMAGGPHPLQSALDTATAASYALVDLIDIARERKPRDASGREGRTDARQVSLYKAVIASSVGAVEETFEALILAGLDGLGTPPQALGPLSRAISKLLQSPYPENLDNQFGNFLGFKPSDYWAAVLAHSPAAHRSVPLKDKSLDYRYIYTTYTGFREFRGSDLSKVLARFVKIRNSFAHQDSSATIFTKEEQRRLQAVCSRKAESDEDIKFVETISTTCAVTLDANTQNKHDPVVRWTVHETQAINALRMYVGLVASSCGALATHLETTGGVQMSDYDRLVLRVQEGAWCDWNVNCSFDAPNVDFELTPYRPSLRQPQKVALEPST